MKKFAIPTLLLMISVSVYAGKFCPKTEFAELKDMNQKELTDKFCGIQKVILPLVSKANKDDEEWVKKLNSLELVNETTIMQKRDALESRSQSSAELLDCISERDRAERIIKHKYKLPNCADWK